MLAIHAAISAADALSIFENEERYTGSNHREACLLFSSLKGTKKAVRQLESLVALKTDAEYGDRSMKRAEAERAIKNTTRFLAFIETRISSNL